MAELLKSMASPSSDIKSHKMKKVNFENPTWCIFAQRFIWGLDKSGYECSVCGIVCSRPQIALCKKTVCSSSYKNEAMVSANVNKGTNKVFSIYLPMGAKKSMIMDPAQPLKDVLTKICRERAIPLEEYYPQDKNGKVVAMSKLLGEIVDGEITFTKKDASQRDTNDNIPPFIEDLLKEEREKNVGGKNSTSSSTTTKTNKGDIVKSSDKIRTSQANSKFEKVSDPLPPLSPKENKLVENQPESTRILDLYALEEELGNGAFSVVYQSRHKKTGEVVAIKVLEKYNDEVTQANKLKREISIHKNLSHENIIKFIQISEDDEHFFVVMELVIGGELFEQICEQKYFYEKEASPLICQVLQGLIYLHDRGIAHRDIKPENLLFSDKDMKTLKIADFGESKTFYDGQLSTYCGTPDYMCPEIIKSEVYGKEVDMWALGVTTFVLLGGYAPFEGENDTEVFAAILTLDYKYIQPEWDHVGSIGKDFIDSMLKIDPSKRLSARQALKHPFITKFSPPELRKMPIVDLGEKSFSENPRQTVLDTIEKFLGVLKIRMPTQCRSEDKLLFGELMYLKQLIVHATTMTLLEKNIFNTAWTRLSEMHEFILG